MKSMIIIAAFLVGGLAHAEGAATTPAASAPAATAKKMDKKTAKADCLKENKDLKGAKLKECIKSKQM